MPWARNFNLRNFVFSIGLYRWGMRQQSRRWRRAGEIGPGGSVRAIPGLINMATNQRLLGKNRRYARLSWPRWHRALARRSRLGSSGRGRVRSGDGRRAEFPGAYGLRGKWIRNGVPGTWNNSLVAALRLIAFPFENRGGTASQSAPFALVE